MNDNYFDFGGSKRSAWAGMESVSPSQGIWTWCQELMLGIATTALSLEAESIEVVGFCLCTRGHVKTVVGKGNQCAFGYQRAT
jgi:hypothetical protein